MSLFSGILAISCGQTTTTVQQSQTPKIETTQSRKQQIPSTTTAPQTNNNTTNNEDDSTNNKVEEQEAQTPDEESQDEKALVQQSFSSQEEEIEKEIIQAYKTQFIPNISAMTQNYWIIIKAYIEKTKEKFKNNNKDISDSVQDSDLHNNGYTEAKK
ncbi:hypothetical protein [Mesomycoplasma hyorhinis]|uniref:hypothetical protein n=1 Tax=Mesomycoplasma hyorhinis TaxID=2100 RepID=UPI001C0433B1|nr:hypothetical protein [Mesomycoplasma hyorhinis]